MGTIHIMSSELVGRIAAGEVVERPASVVKELVENSIDAGATNIRINIEQGGRKLIQVIDNGCGMDKSDAMLCLETHATSKMTATGDVGQIVTLGFRGEALPSIASVSHFTIQTRRRDDSVGTEITVDYGKIRNAMDCGCAPGTNIRVAQLFANLPARQKFMRGPETEDGYIEEMVRLLALARPHVSIALFTNNRETLRVNATNDIGLRVAAVMGKEIFSAMLPVNYTEAEVQVRGYITNPGYTRSSRREQRVIVNGRAATADTVFFAIRDAYDALIMKGRYPGAVLYIDLPADKVDVNVHPTKREVRFRDSRLISQIIGAAIRKALRGMAGGEELSINDQTKYAAQPQQIPQSPQVQPQQPCMPSQMQQPCMPPQVQQPCMPPQPQMPPHPAFTAPRPVQIQINMPQMPPQQQPMRENSTPEQNGAVGHPTGNGHASLKNLHHIGMLSRHYALAESENGLVIVNLKAAHQRILFERLLAGLNAQSMPQQQLLIPITLDFSLDDARFIRAQNARFQQLGFSIEAFGGNTFLITAVPAAVTDNNIEQMLRDMIEDLRQCPVTTRQSAIHIAQAACRHAVFSNDTLTDTDARNIMHQLAETEMPYACPNGHPTMIHITYAELAKRFSL